jgi:hypothetical protein
MTKRWCLLAALPLAIACTAERPPPQPVFAEVPRSSPLHFSYALAEGKGALGSDRLRGRPSVLVFVTTYDIASQAQVRFLSGVARRLVGRIHAAAIVLEPPDNRPIVIAFRDALKLEYPVAMGDPPLIAGEGPFGDVHTVPSTVVLDSEGRLVRRRVGLLANEEEIENMIRGL